MPPHISSRLAAVRAFTSAQHVQLDAALGGRGAVSSAPGYRRLLLVTAAILERFAAPWDRASVAVGLPPAGPLLNAALDVDLASLDLDWPPLVPPGPQQVVEPLSYAAGVGYALEGSALGAKVILRAVQRAGGPEQPASYYRLLADAAETRWPLFCRWLDHATLDDGAVMRGANDVFTTALGSVDDPECPTVGTGLS